MSVFTRVPPPPSPSHPLLDRLWSRYVADVPYAAKFARLFAREHGAFKNDHIAFRSLAQGPGIAGFANVFQRLGWEHAGDYAFPDVHLRAIYMTHPRFPRVFISELDAEQLTGDARDILLDLAIDATPPPGNIDALAAWFGGPRPPPPAALAIVSQSSQYGAWLLAFGRRVNHFTAVVDDVELWHKKLLHAGVPMKDSIEGERGGKLRQTATHAALAHVMLADGTVKKMPYAYFEIAERRDGFDGFLAPQARQLFDMTRTEELAVVEDVAPPYLAERRFPRKDVIVPVDVSWGDRSVALRVTTSNLSLGGVFLAFGGHTAPTRGTAVRVRLDLPGGELAATGVVMWTLGDQGAGVAFTSVDELMLAAFLEPLR